MALFTIFVASIGMLQVAQDAPVTEAEGYKVLEVVQNAMANAVHAKHLAAPKLDMNSDKPLNREALLDELKRISDSFETYYKVRPRLQYLDTSFFKVSAKRKKEAISLVQLGFLDTMSPVLVNPKPTLSVEDFGTAMGFFIERFADRTHMPSITYSPALMNDPKAKPSQSSSPRAPAPSKPGQPRA